MQLLRNETATFVATLQQANIDIRLKLKKREILSNSFLHWNYECSQQKINHEAVQLRQKRAEAEKLQEEVVAARADAGAATETASVYASQLQHTKDQAAQLRTEIEAAREDKTIDSQKIVEYETTIEKLVEAVTELRQRNGILCSTTHRMVKEHTGIEHTIQ